VHLLTDIPSLTIASTTMRPHAAERWASAVAGVLRSDSDVRNIDAWGRTVGVSRGALRTWCSAAGVPAKNSLDFARLLRSILLSQGGPWDLFNTLDVIDARTLHRLLIRGGIAEFRQRGQAPEARAFLAAQRLVQNKAALAAVAEVLGAHERPAVQRTRRAS
jgi:hypothetical protein